MPELADHSKRAFEDTVKAVLTTFGVFTGFAIKESIEKLDPDLTSNWTFDARLFVCIATIALLLRFIIGSAVHLNLCYVVEPRSKSPVMFFKDLAFLIVFGLCAAYTIAAKGSAKGPDPDLQGVTSFALRAALFVAVGLLWSAVDWLVRRHKTDPGEKPLFSGLWIVIDIVQLIFIAALFYLIDDDFYQSIGLAVGFLVALFGDLIVVLAAKKPRVADPLPSARPAPSPLDIRVSALVLHGWRDSGARPGLRRIRLLATPASKRDRG